MIFKNTNQLNESVKPKGKLLMQDEIDDGEESDVLETKVMQYDR